MPKAQRLSIFAYLPFAIAYSLFDNYASWAYSCAAMPKTFCIQSWSYRFALVIPTLMLSLMSLGAGGCGGYYILTVPDQLAKTGGRVVPVARLQRNDFFVLALAMPGQPMRFGVYATAAAADEAAQNKPVPEALRSPERVCRGDKIGYSAVEIPMYENPIANRPGKYYLKVALQDYEGEQIAAIVPLYVWDPAKSVVAVDLDALPREAFPHSDQAAAAMRKIARKSNIIYLTRNSKATQHSRHGRLDREDFPDGPVLLWQRKRWHIVRSGKLRIPKIIIESRLDSQLGQLKLDFPKLSLGICTSPLAAKAFVRAGMECIVVGNDWVKGSTIRHYKSWQDLAERGVE